MANDIYKPSNHAPPHLFRPNSHYIVTAGTLGKRPFFNTGEKRTLLLNTLISEGEDRNWRLEAWAILPNHYHFVAQSPQDSTTLSKLIQAVHSKTAIALNRLDKTPGRKIWYQYWDTCIVDDNAHHTRLKYVHENPAKHGLVDDPSAYPWCSMRWFLDNATNEFRSRVLASTTQAPNIPDDF
ncbi:MAG: transposase [Candidatus Hydrogenedentes bacterium]|nr:transposase [Candidatus Hydrogenedentota bacterium]